MDVADYTSNGTAAVARAANTRELDEARSISLKAASGACPTGLAAMRGDGT